MAISNVQATFSCDIKTVWDIVTSLDNYSWRSDLSKITRLNEKQFIEHTKDGFETTENVTAKKMFMKPFVKIYLKKQQTAYIQDLKRALEK